MHTYQATLAIETLYLSAIVFMVFNKGWKCVSQSPHCLMNGKYFRSEVVVNSVGPGSGTPKYFSLNRPPRTK